MTNKFKSPCSECGQSVPAGEGVLNGKKDGKWLVKHETCPTFEAVVETAAPSSKPAVDSWDAPAPAPTFTPTAEQQAALDLFASGESMVIEAGAGTGKTSTLKLLAQSTTRKGQYIAFNKAIVDEASAKFPSNVRCNTAHSLAYHAIGKQFSHRLNSSRQTASAIASLLRIRPITVTIDQGLDAKTLHTDFLAGHVMSAVGNFCRSADDEIERRHFSYIDGIDLPTSAGRRTHANNDEVAETLLPIARRAWEDLSSKTGQLRFGHDHYLKLWQLAGPRIEADFILFDEAQDANPVMAAVVAAQTHAQVVYVGDSQQAIYEFTGAVNTLQRLATDHRVFLTQSFRFGPKLAEVANDVLANLDADLRLVGTDALPTTIGFAEREDAILTRTNAAAVQTVLELQKAGRRPHLVGGGKEIVSFAKAARDLQSSGSTSHPELACFSSWEAVKTYVNLDANGAELRLLVNLVEKFGVPTILDALDRMPSEAQADVVVSTAHKAKGREWDNVRLAGDFPTGFNEDGEVEEIAEAEHRLIYVAVTRAKVNLDLSAIQPYFDGWEAEGEGPGFDDEDDVEARIEADREEEAEVLAALVDEETVSLASRPRWGWKAAGGAAA